MTEPTESDPPPNVERTPGRGRNPQPQRITPAVPADFGLVQVWWGAGKGKSTAAMGMGFRAAGHGYRVHMVQLMKGGASSVEDVRGEYNAIEAFTGFSYENLGHYGWHGLHDGTSDSDHARRATAGFERTKELIEAAAGVTGPLDPTGPPEDGMHMLIVDEILYAVERELIAPDTLLDVIERKPPSLELVLTGGHSEPTFLYDHADLISQVRKEKHPIDAGIRARKGTEY